MATTTIALIGFEFAEAIAERIRMHAHSQWTGPGSPSIVESSLAEAHELIVNRTPDLCQIGSLLL